MRRALPHVIRVEVEGSAGEIQVFEETYDISDEDKSEVRPELWVARVNKFLYLYMWSGILCHSM